MKKILREIQNGQFAREWILENLAGRPVFEKAREEGRSHRIEDVGARLREMMSWIRNIRKDHSEPVQQGQQREHAAVIDYPLQRSGAV
jgi:ketol-acid reductoisomerase